MEIFNERCFEDSSGRYVLCARTGQRIYESQITTYNFSHIKSKGSRPELKFNKNNVEIVSVEVHGQHHCSGKFNNYLPIK